jgi:probable rRNA maturation factor
MLDFAVQRAWGAEVGDCAPDDDALEAWAEAALRAARPDLVDRPGAPPLELTLRLVDEAEGQTLNAAFRGQNHPTNVLSFPWEPPGDAAVDLFPVLGDLVMCGPVVQREAAEQGKPLAHHWAHLVVHGVLHLCGHDHVDELDATIMEALERCILADLGIPDPYLELDGVQPS